MKAQQWKSLLKKMGADRKVIIPNMDEKIIRWRDVHEGGTEKERTAGTVPSIDCKPQAAVIMARVVNLSSVKKMGSETIRSIAVSQELFEEVLLRNFTILTIFAFQIQWEKEQHTRGLRRFPIEVNNDKKRRTPEHRRINPE